MEEVVEIEPELQKWPSRLHAGSPLRRNFRKISGEISGNLTGFFQTRELFPRV
jgi:hypothetical protein